jgi:hypothetical protein
MSVSLLFGNREISGPPSPAGRWAAWVRQ